MAEGFLNALLSKDNYRVSSAGIMALQGGPTSENSIKAMDGVNINISNYRSTPFTIKEANENDIILTLSESHKEYILDNFQFTEDKVFTLKEYAGSRGSVDDPYGMSLDHYIKCRDEINKLCLAIADKLNK